MGHYMNLKKSAVGLGLGALIAVSAAVPALADTVTTTITGGNRTASIDAVDLGSAAYSHTDQQLNGSMALSVDDKTGTGDGWNVTVKASDFAYTGDNAGTAIGADNLVLGTIADPVYVEGQQIDAIDGPLAFNANDGMALDTDRKVIFANAGFGSGSYTQSLPVTLTRR